MRWAWVVMVVALSGCTSQTEPEAEPSPAARSAGTGSTSPSPTASPTPTPTPQPLVTPDDLDVSTAARAVRHLAGEIGPRPGTTPAYFRAAAWVERRFTASGWRVERQRFPTPAGYSWNGPVEAGPSVNLIATHGTPRPGRPWLLVGAHLDTVVDAPGAEDNASGVGVLLAVAEALQDTRSRLPVVLVAFGSEEPRGEGDAHHHYGSRAYVASLTTQQRRSLAGMVSLDRVGVGEVLPVGSPAEPNALTDQLVAAARRAGVETVLDPFQTSSDHWSFVREGLPGARLGSTPYAAYHDRTDTPEVVQRAQLERTARTVLAWLG
ncbi:M28 family metallopeptidase [Nocardioides sp. cx-169]|uniref:M28 family metallopeptidase n=1 Tax=Nocardioides sp. cx-169 TaxID=2899080 RepID=UPI001E472E4B|nr:M28 family metallopeptidase [Nocardioides sp. cx-169]MCD4533378.1 M28 family metallopeptidase [Nocardioides sp. cx-169]